MLFRETTVFTVLPLGLFNDLGILNLHFSCVLTLRVHKPENSYSLSTDASDLRFVQLGPWNPQVIGIGAGLAGPLLAGPLFWRFNEIHYISAWIPGL